MYICVRVCARVKLVSQNSDNCYFLTFYRVSSVHAEYVMPEDARMEDTRRLACVEFGTETNATRLTCVNAENDHRENHHAVVLGGDSIVGDLRRNSAKLGDSAVINSGFRSAMRLAFAAAR